MPLELCSKCHARRKDTRYYVGVKGTLSRVRICSACASKQVDIEPAINQKTAVWDEKRKAS